MLLFALALVLDACGARTELNVMTDAAPLLPWADAAPPPRVADAVEVAVSGSYACLRREGGQVHCWGSSLSGRLGAPCDRQTNDDRATPAPTGTGLRATSLSIGTPHACVLQDDGVWCWGSTREGQLMDVDRDVLCPERLPIERPDAVFAMAGGVCIISAERALSCWGQGDHGELGAGPNTEPVLEPVTIPLANVVQVASSSHHTCARTLDGAIYCWGLNDFAQVGEPAGPDVHAPRRVEGLPPATDISLGTNHSCAIAAADIWCWGDNARGALGLGDRSPQAGPVRTNVRGVRRLAQGNATCAIHMDGRVTCWSTTTSGLLRRGPDDVSPVTIPLPWRAVSVAAISTGCAVLEDGSVWCWGSGTSGQLGNGTIVERSLVPVPVVGFP